MCSFDYTYKCSFSFTHYVTFCGILIDEHLCLRTEVARIRKYVFESSTLPDAKYAACVNNSLLHTSLPKIFCTALMFQHRGCFLVPVFTSGLKKIMHEAKQNEKICIVADQDGLATDCTFHCRLYYGEVSIASGMVCVTSDLFQLFSNRMKRCLLSLFDRKTSFLDYIAMPLWNSTLPDRRA